MTNSGIDKVRAKRHALALALVAGLVGGILSVTPSQARADYCVELGCSRECFSNNGRICCRMRCRRRCYREQPAYSPPAYDPPTYNEPTPVYDTPTYQPRQAATPFMMWVDSLSNEDRVVLLLWGLLGLFAFAGVMALLTQASTTDAMRTATAEVENETDLVRAATGDTRAAAQAVDDFIADSARASFHAGRAQADEEWTKS